MKIISKFHDYYDSAMIMHDDHIILKRATEEIEAIELPYNSIHVGTKSLKQDDKVLNKALVIDILYFCGKIYPIFSCKKYQDSYNREKRQRNTDLLDIEYFDGIDSFFEKFKEENFSTSYYSLFRKSKNKDFLDVKKQYKDLLNKISEYEVSVDLFRKADAPYFQSAYLNHKKYIIRYPVLKDLTKSFKLDAFSAFQEIDMYMSGVIGIPENNIIEISDIDKRDSKGFDKYSFKTRKA